MKAGNADNGNVGPALVPIDWSHKPRSRIFALADDGDDLGNLTEKDSIVDEAHTTEYSRCRFVPIFP